MVALVEKASIFSTPYHRRREDFYLATQRSGRCNSYTITRCMQRCRIRAISFDSTWGRKTMRKTAGTNDEVRHDSCTESFWVLWVIGQKAFVVVRVFDPNTRRYSKQTLKLCYSLNEKQKKRHYDSKKCKWIKISVFTIAGGMRSEGRAFYSRVPRLMLLKNEIRISKVTSWIQSKANFALLRTMFICLRGLRQKLINEKLELELEHLSIKNKLIKII